MRASFCLILLVTSSAWAGQVTFTGQPAATRDGGEVKISFAVSAPTDVAVYVLDAKGRTVRHLAAGLLGENAPPPLNRGSLEQELVWNGKDDAGQPADGGPFRVRVAAGMGARYDGTAFGSEAKPDDLTNVIGLAPRPGGGLYVLSERWKRIWWRQTTIHVFGPDGQYERTIKPYPAEIDAAKVKPLTPLVYDDGRPLPVVHRVLAMSYYPYEDLAQQMAADRGGNLHFLVLRAAYRKDAGKYVATISAEGGVPLPAYAGAELLPDASAGDPYLALSSDGQTLFATGLERGPRDDSGERPNRPAVWKIPLPARNKAETFFGNPEMSGGGETALSDPRGLASDGRGRLYVADRGNNRVVVLDEQSGKFVGSFNVDDPTWVGASRKTGAVYVASGEHVIKFALGGDGSAKETARAKLPPIDERHRSRAKRSFALDDSQEKAVLWVGHDRGGEALLLCEETDSGFGDFRRAGCRPAEVYWNLFAAQDGRTIGCKVGRTTVRILDEETGETRDLVLHGSPGQTYRLGPNGQIYGMDHWKWAIRRWDRNGEYLPYPTTKDDPELQGRLPSVPSGTTAWERDFDVDRAGNVYVKHRGKTYHGRMTVDKYDPDGNFVGRVLWVVSDGCYGPRVDPAGNLYIAEAVRPPGKEVPDFFRDRLPEARIDKHGNPLQQYRWMYGSIIKFSPKGGAVWFPVINEERDLYAFEGEARLPEGLKKAKVDTGQGDLVATAPGELEGALWQKYGCSYVLDMNPSHNRRCHCTATEFEVDDFGRTFYTDQGRFRVVVLDTGGNEILSFGRYGNQDSCGPEIAINWFTGLGVTDRFVYVADGGNLRVVKARLVYAADETCPVE
jgi:sugar lactone lactonase YvrE